MKRARPARIDEAHGAKVDGGAVVFWLVLMAGAVLDIVNGRTRPAWLASTALAVFVVLFTVTVLAGGRLGARDRLRYPLMGALFVVTTVYVLRFGHATVVAVVLLGMAAATVLPLLRPALTGIGLAMTVAVLITLRDFGGDVAGIFAQSGLIWGTGTASTVIFVIRRLFATIRELHATREELARAAVDQERLRFSRDLHDLLGHTLSLIVVKAEVVQRLASRAPDAAAAQAGDIVTVGRDALGEVREAVSGYRERGVSAELDEARTVLDDAGVAATIRRSGPPVSGDADILLGWVLREGVTNVIRHSGAHRCEIHVTHHGGHAGVRIHDDGTGDAHREAAASPGNGLTGLAERLTAVRGELLAGPGPHGGFTLHATVPVPDTTVEERE